MAVRVDLAFRLPVVCDPDIAVLSESAFNISKLPIVLPWRLPDPIRNRLRNIRKCAQVGVCVEVTRHLLRGFLLTLRANSRTVVGDVGILIVQIFQP